MKTAWSLGGETGNHAPLVAGLTFMARSDRGRVVALRTVSVDSSAGGTLTLEARSVWPEP